MKHVEKPLREVDHLHIRLYIAANVLIDHRWDAEEVCSTYWRFYVNSHHGASAVVAGGEVYPLIARRIHFIPAWVRWSCRNTQSIEHLYAHFDLVGLPGAVVRRCFPGPVTLPADERLERNCESLRQLLGSGNGASDMAAACEVKAVLFGCLARLMSGLGSERSANLVHFAHGHNPVAQALHFIDEHLGEPMTNHLLAQQCGFAESHFARLFRLQICQTPAQYVLERRITFAAERLSFSEDSIERIAEVCGFPDRFYFSRMFVRRMGQPPAAYRRTSRV